MTMVEVVAPGMLTTVQDLGRTGWRASGVGPGGAIDTVSHRLANLLVGNPEDAAAFEITLSGPRLRFLAASWVALTGATIDATVVTHDGRSSRVPGWHPFWVPAEATLACDAFAIAGCRATLAIAGGLDVPIVLGGRGTDIRSGFGGFRGRPLKTGDRVPIGVSRRTPPADPARVVIEPRSVANDLRSVPHGATGPAEDAMTIRVLAGPEFADFPISTRSAFFTVPFTVTPDADRSGCRLSGGPLEAPRMTLSEAVMAGTIQVPPSGHPIVLAADHPVTGGYPRIAVVATIDLPRLGQARPGARLRFIEIGLDQARSLLTQRERTIRTVAAGLEHLR